VKCYARPTTIRSKRRRATARCASYTWRGLYLAGDIDGLGRAILERFAGDQRGHFARHAQAVLFHNGSRPVSVR